MKKHLLVILLSLLLVIVTACSSAKFAPQNEDKRGSSNLSEGYGQETPTEDGNVSLSDDVAFQRKIIKNGTLNLEAENVEQAYTNILAFAKVHGGYEFKNEKSKNDDYTKISAQIKISPEGLDLLMNYAGSAAEVINSKVNSDDITSDYYDTQIRLDAQKKSLTQYYKFLEQAATIDETLRIQSEINKLTTQIESLEGKIKLWNALVSESTLDLTINQKNDPLKPKKDIHWNALNFADMSMLIKGGFISVVNVLVSILQWIAIILISISPLLLITGIILWLVSRRKKARRLNALKQKTGGIPPQNQ